MDELTQADTSAPQGLCPEEKRPLIAGMRRGQASAKRIESAHLAAEVRVGTPSLA